MAITVTQGWDYVLDLRKNISELTPSQQVRLANFVNREIRNSWAEVDPKHFVTYKSYLTYIGTNNYALPSDYQDQQYAPCGVFQTLGGTQYAVFSHGTVTGTFTVGQTITGSTTAATGVIVDVNSAGFTTITVTSGIFEPETITTSTGSAVADGFQEFQETFYRLPEFINGDTSEGFSIEGDEIKFTPVPTREIVYRLAYIPAQTDLAAVSDTFVVGDRFQELIRAGLLYQFDLFNKDLFSASNSAQLWATLLEDFRRKVKKTPKTMSMRDISGSFSRNRFHSVRTA